MDKKIKEIKSLISLLKTETEIYENEKERLDKFMKLKAELLIDHIANTLLNKLYEFVKQYGNKPLLEDDLILDYMKQNNMKSILNFTD